MCGISGIVGKYADDGVMTKMVSAMQHRGPDDLGTFFSDGISLGMTRLAVLDLSSLGHQPMQSHCKRYWIVYNGECYNYRKIRDRLEGLGTRFISDSDTEVVLQAYVRWGRKCLYHMNGMYAFAVWDTLEKKLFAARDRMGIKPFYYALAGHSLVFASELKALLSSNVVPFEPDPRAVYQYFTFGHVIQPLTIAKDIFALMPGHFLEWNTEGMRIERYWSLEHIHETPIGAEEAKEFMLEKLDGAVRSQMLSDRPVGLFLSGGLDSATILACMARSGAKVNTFSLGFDANPYIKNEEKEARELAEFFGSSHNQVSIRGEEVAGSIEHFFDHLDQPSVDGLNTYLVSKYAVMDMTVALSGLGGDELFGGYTRQFLLWWKYHRANGWLAQAVNQIVPGVLDRDLLLRVRAGLSGKEVLFNYTLIRAGGIPGRQARILSNMVRNHVNSPGDILGAFRHFDLPGSSGAFNRILNLDLQGFMGSQLLRDMDALSMAHSLEVRFPLIDHDVVEFAFRLPPELRMAIPENRPFREGKMSYGQLKTKRLLLETMLPHLPCGFENRSKSGFKLPIVQWLQNELRDFGLDLLNDALTSQDEINRSAIADNINKLQKRNGNLHECWKLIAFLGVLKTLRRPVTIR